MRNCFRIAFTILTNLAIASSRSEHFLDANVASLLQDDPTLIKGNPKLQKSFKIADFFWHIFDFMKQCFYILILDQPWCLKVYFWI